MAVTYIRSVRSDPARTIAYAADPEKTGGGELVSGINCLPEFAAEQFAQTAAWWRRRGGVRCYHIYQSFLPGEADPAEAHRIGVMLARELYGDRFEAVVATHCNTGAVHNHIVVSAVSLTDGGKYPNDRGSYPRLRAASDRICAGYGLSLVSEPRGRRVNYGEWLKEKSGGITIRQTVRNDIDCAVAHSGTWRSFLRFLRDRGYDIALTGSEGRPESVGFQPPGARGHFNSSSLGNEYCAERINGRLLEAEPFIGRYRRPPPAALQDPQEMSDRELIVNYLSLLQDIYRDPSGYGDVDMEMRRDIAGMERFRDLLQKEDGEALAGEAGRLRDRQTDRTQEEDRWHTRRMQLTK